MRGQYRLKDFGKLVEASWPTHWCWLCFLGSFCLLLAILFLSLMVLTLISIFTVPYVKLRDFTKGPFPYYLQRASSCPQILSVFSFSGNLQSLSSLLPALFCQPLPVVSCLYHLRWKLVVHMCFFLSLCLSSILNSFVPPVCVLHLFCNLHLVSSYLRYFLSRPELLRDPRGSHAARTYIGTHVGQWGAQLCFAILSVCWRFSHSLGSYLHCSYSTL